MKLNYKPTNLKNNIFMFQKTFAYKTKIKPNI